LGLIGGFRQRDMDLLWRLIPFKRLHARLFGAPRG